MSLESEPDVVPASRRARVLSVTLGLLAVLVGSPVLYLTRRYLDDLTALAQTDRAAAISGFTIWVLPQLVLVALIGLAAGCWTIREGLRAYRAGRYPRADMWVLHDTPVRRGADARRIGMLFVLTGATLAIVPAFVVAVLAALLWRSR